ncbi:MAG: hypothetical protein JNL40_14080 [Cyclobacteriaceae bacterium]|nr:hypothetical protein [Cyclobacteriaceae bacterium]
MEAIDLLIAFNQNLPIDAIRPLTSGRRNAVFLSSHQVFPNEREAIAALGFQDFQILTFSDLLTDAELEAIDNRVSSSLGHAAPQDFIPMFSENINYEKNALAYSRLLDRYSFLEVYACGGLGISARFWKEKGAHLLGELPTTGSWGIMDRLRAKANHLMSVVPVHVVRSGTTAYLFYGPVRRLRFVEGTQVESGAVRVLFGGFDRFVRQRSKIGNGIPSTTIHGFTDPALLKYRDLHIFIDGFHPPNYTRSYIDFYGDAIFVTRTMFDNQWFSQNGKRTIKLPALIRKDVMRKLSAVGRIRTVIALLNHAGDWSALINRSDTDRLVAAVAGLSERFQQINFIIRVHPTMVHEHHEGRNSIQRIKEYVRWMNRSNLSVSQLELHEDFERGDLFLSEYSQTAIDAAVMGKRILVTNLTGRRSFMKCYEDLGFPSVTSTVELVSWLEEQLADPTRGDQQQNEAVDLYNRMLDDYLAAD